MIKQIITGIGFVILLAGCSGTPTREERYEGSPIPTSSKTMHQIYNENSGAAQRPTTSNNEPLVNVLPMGVNPLNEWQKSTTNSFKLLPNPTLQVYYPAKINKEGIPIPAWTTEIRMYDKDEYALPGELGGY